MKLKGTPVSEGIAIGKVFIYQAVSLNIEEKHIAQGEVESAVKRLKEVKEACKAELAQIAEQIGEHDEAKIFAAHIEILEDDVLAEEIEEAINQEFLSPDYAVWKIFGMHAEIIGRAKNPMIRERAADITDVRNRILYKWNGIEAKTLSGFSEPIILIAEDLLPSETATLDKKNVLAIVAQKGGVTSHTAILAKNLGIPAVLGVEDIMNVVKDGETIVVDALLGEILTDLCDDAKDEYCKKREKCLQDKKDIECYLYRDAESKDGVKVDIGLNIGSADCETIAMSKYVDMVGLFRTEFLYMETDHLPDEQTQFLAYQQILEAMGDKPVIMRTLDIGGDKTLPALQCKKEENPFLGVRALRLCFANPEVFRTQLRAALRASVFGNLWLMFPMVGSLDDFRRAKKTVADVMDELKSEGIAFSPNIKLGAMIEIPSIAIMADMLVKEADFASIGTNDLCQYTLAADRVNPCVGEYYQSFHPGLFRLINTAAKAFCEAGKPIGVCGELGGDPLAAPVLFGMGINELSMSISSVAKIKKIISLLSQAQMQEMAENVLKMDTEQTVKDYLNKELSSLL